MRKIITQDVINDMILDAKKHFYKCPKQTRYAKSLLKTIPVNIRFCPLLKVTYGVAYVINCYGPGKYESGIRRRYNLNKKEAIQFQGGIFNLFYKYPLMVLNKDLLQKVPKNEVYDTVSHELAHILDIFLHGDTYHDKTWRNLHLSMNGSGTTYGQYIHPLQLQAQ